MIASIHQLVDFLAHHHRHRMADPSLPPKAIPKKLPEGLGIVYRRLGALVEIPNGPFHGQDRLIPVSRLPYKRKWVEFVEENQSVWSCEYQNGETDPPVYSDAPNLAGTDGGEHFALACPSLNHFLTTLCLQEAVLSAPFLFTSANRPIETVLGKIPEPLWLDGVYVWGEPSHSFFYLEEYEAVLMRHLDSSIWIGAYSDDFKTALMNVTEWQDIRNRRPTVPHITT